MKGLKVLHVAGALLALLLAGCGDGSVKSPDFEATTTVTALTIEPATDTQSNSLPAGTTLSYRAIATFTTSAPPGQTAPDARTEDVTGSATWTSSNDTIAAVEKGLVTGKAARAMPVVITARYQDQSATVSVTTTAAILKSVIYAKVAGGDRATDDKYSALSGNSVPFELYGRFSDQANDAPPLLLDDTAFGITWASGDPAVASNTAGGNVFQTLSVGSTTITGIVTQQADGSALTADVSPSSASATLAVGAANAFCESEFLATNGAKTSAEPSPLCLGCSITDADNVIDGDMTTDAAMNIPLGLLGSARLGLDVSNANSALIIGKRVGLVLSRSADILSVQLLHALKLETVDCDADGKNCETIESFDPTGNLLHLSLLGLLGAEPQYLLTSPPITKAANGIRLTFGGGVVGLLATLHVQSACTAAIPQGN
jgi:hypothetical protein